MGSSSSIKVSSTTTQIDATGQYLIPALSDMHVHIIGDAYNIFYPKDTQFSKYLYLQSEPDIIIRTSGELRTSNFLMWQQAYSEWFFIKKFWPDFEKQDLIDAVEEFKESRKRRFGK